jgi:hypothetical protein
VPGAVYRLSFQARVDQTHPVEEAVTETARGRGNTKAKTLHFQSGGFFSPCRKRSLHAQYGLSKDEGWTVQDSNL